MKGYNITRAELLRDAIRRVQDLAIDCGLDARIGLHVKGSIPSDLGPLKHEHDFEVSRSDGTVSDCGAYLFAERVDNDRHDITIIVERSRRPKAEAV